MDGLPGVGCSRLAVSARSCWRSADPKTGSPGVVQAGENGWAGKGRLVGAGCPLLGVSLALGRAMLQAKATCPGASLPAKRREGQRIFRLLRFAWRCAIKIMACGSIIRTLPVEKRALAGMGILRQQG